MSIECKYTGCPGLFFLAAVMTPDSITAGPKSTENNFPFPQLLNVSSMLIGSPIGKAGRPFLVIDSRKIRNIARIWPSVNWVWIADRKVAAVCPKGAASTS